VSTDPSADEVQIRARRAESNAAIARHDLAALAETMMEEYHGAASNGSFRRGREDAISGLAVHFAAFEDAVYVRTPESIEVNTVGEVAAEVGSWVGTWSGLEGPVRTGGRYAAYWRKVEGVWRIHAELFVPLFRQESTD